MFRSSLFFTSHPPAHHTFLSRYIPGRMVNFILNSVYKTTEYVMAFEYVRAAHSALYSIARSHFTTACLHHIYMLCVCVYLDGFIFMHRQDNNANPHFMWRA